MGKQKISFISTVFNEEKTLEAFLDSILGQSQLPDEVVIVDGGSSDRTFDVLKDYEERFEIAGIEYRFLQKKGNRSVGRNEAIRHASHEIIACSDAGCWLDKEWLRYISATFSGSGKVSRKGSVDVVSGYYTAVTDGPFQKALAAYTSVMPDRLNPETFLPSSRSIGFRKDSWKAVGRYPEELDTCEDLVFAQNLKKAGLNFAFQKKAIVSWPQKRDLFEAFWQFFSYARGDGKAFYIRPQTPLLFLRYVAAMLMWFYLPRLLLPLVVAYIFWAILKNYRYVRHWKAIIYLPLLQLSADIAVMSGMIAGLLDRLKK